jgi:membrane-bound inhibitor of C-type lysozyme
MNRRKITLFGAVLCVVAVATGASPAVAQKTSFQTYRCADGSEFIVGFFEYDPRAHVQVDGKSVTLAKRVALSGSRYSGAGVTLKMTKKGVRLKHARRPETACEAVI